MALLGLTVQAQGTGSINPGPESGWQTLGTGTYNDGLACAVYPSIAPGTSWEVSVQNNPSNPGWYRLQPFAGDWPGVDIAGESNTWLVINATDPDKTFIVDTGRMFTLTDGWWYVFSQIVPWNLEKDEPQYGSLSNGVITFPANSFYVYKLSPAGSYDRTVQTLLPTSQYMTITLPNAGVDEVIIDEAVQPEYYSLEGIKVAEPEHGRIYIERRGATTSLVVK